MVGGTARGGITKRCRLGRGGGSFRALAVADSILEQRDGLFLLTVVDQMNGEFALAVCPQIGFSLAPDPPFVGRKGRQRLAALNGVADEEAIRAETPPWRWRARSRGRQGRDA